MTPRRLLARLRLPEDRPALAAAVCALLYTLLALVYIPLSGRIAARYAGSVEQLESIEAVKGRLFVLVTGFLFFVVSLGWWRTMRRQRHLLVQNERRLLASTYHAALAHDLNNMLMALSGLVEELRQRGPVDEELDFMREAVENALDGLAPLARRIAGISRRESPAEWVAVDLADCLTTTLELARKHPDVRTCSVRLDAAPGLVAVLDRGLLEQAVLNLVVNAAQATGEGGDIEVAARRTKEGISLQVHDNGPGIPPERAETIFAVGYTSKPEGSGLGLLSVRALAAACRGEVSVSRSPLGGALFGLVLPGQEGSGGPGSPCGDAGTAGGN